MSERTRQLVLEYGWNTTVYQILNPGISHWFSRGGDGVVGYVRYAGVRIVAGAPVCPEERLEVIAREFEADAGNERVCYFGAEERLEAVCTRRGGYAMLSLGAQPVWTPAGFVAIVEKHASLRAQLNRARNKGVTVERVTAQPANLAELESVLAAWLGSKGLPPLHFLIEPETLSRLDDRQLFIARRQSQVVGFLVASPIPTRQGWLIEQNVRAPGAPNGVSELLVAEAARSMAAAGSEYMTLGLAPLSVHGPPPVQPVPWWIRGLMGWVRAHGRRFYNFKGLDAFKAKFQPMDWTPVYAIGRGETFSPRLLYGIAAAFSGGSPVKTVGGSMIRAALQEVRWLRTKARHSTTARD